MRTITAVTIVALLAIPFTLLACKGDAASTDSASVCKKLGELATKEGGEALELWNKEMKDDCAQEVEKDRQKLGDAKFKELVDCINTKDSFTAAAGCGG
jgi:hypothetical protein